jgi:phosphoserine phosphatase RsbU/P
MIKDIVNKLSVLLHGEIPATISEEDISTDCERELAEVLNQLIEFTREIHDFIEPLSQGKLNGLKIRPKNFLGSPFKEMHSRLVHLTWQAKQVADGDYSQRVDFMGEFSEAFNAMVVALDQKEKTLKNKIVELEEALAHIKRLEGMLPICSHCKRIRVDGAAPEQNDSWVQIESYLSDKTDVLFTHGICPGCIRKLYPGQADKILSK